MVRLRYLESVENLLGFVWESNVPSTVGRPLVDSIIKFVNTVFPVMIYKRLFFFEFGNPKVTVHTVHKTKGHSA